RSRCQSDETIGAIGEAAQSAAGASVIGLFGKDRPLFVAGQLHEAPGCVVTAVAVAVGGRGCRDNGVRVTAESCAVAADHEGWLGLLRRGQESSRKADQNARQAGVRLNCIGIEMLGPTVGIVEKLRLGPVNEVVGRAGHDVANAAARSTMIFTVFADAGV